MRRGRATDCGATAVEYALLVTFIATVIFAAVAVFGVAVSGLFAAPF
jgi:Flp pilus assembly pilin Flp